VQDAFDELGVAQVTGGEVDVDRGRSEQTDHRLNG
jgi:hypothetical protein